MEKKSERPWFVSEDCFKIGQRILEGYKDIDDSNIIVTYESIRIWVGNGVFGIDLYPSEIGCFNIFEKLYIMGCCRKAIIKKSLL